MPGITGLIKKNDEKLNEDERRLFTVFSKPLESDNISVKAQESDRHLAAVLTIGVIPNNFVTFDNNVTICIFGEIFNHLGTEESPEQYVHRLYRQDGIRCIEKLNGSFVLFIYDKKERAYFVGTDKLGTKPVIYYTEPGRLWFAPQLKSFLALPDLPRKANLGAIAGMLSSYCVHNSDTYIEKVDYLLGGTYLKVQGGVITEVKYWDYCIEYDEDRGDHYYHEKLRDLLVTAVDRRTRQAEETGLFLSGGFDSRAILGCCRELGRKLLLFTYGARNVKHSDNDVARRLADLVGMERVFYKLGAEHSIDSIRDSVRPFDGMRFWIFEYTALKEWQSRAKFALMGDEIFGWNDALLRTEQDMFRIIKIHALAKQPWSLLLKEDMYHSLANHFESVMSDISKRCSLADLHDRKDYFYVTERVHRNILPARYCHSTHFEVRNPWLDDDIVDFMRRVPVHRRKGKALFRNVVQDMFPDLFTVPGGISAGKVTLAAKRENRLKYFNVWQEAVLGREYPIDEIFNREALSNFLSTDESINTKIKALAVSSVSPMLLKSVQKTFSWMSKFSQYPLKFESEISTQQALERIVILRHIVGEQMGLSL